MWLLCSGSGQLCPTLSQHPTPLPSIDGQRTQECYPWLPSEKAAFAFAFVFALASASASAPPASVDSRGLQGC